MNPLHPLQSPAWATFRSRMNIDVVALNEWYVTFHHIPHMPWTIGYFPKGPFPTNTMVQELKKIGKEKKAIFIQLEPNVISSPSSKFETPNSLVSSHHPLFTQYTFILDLTKTEEELLKAMHTKSRYNIKVAQKHDVSVQEDNSPQAFEEYLRLSKETTGRQGFFAHNQQYHHAMWQTMHDANIAHLWTATYQGKTLATWMIFTYGDTVYYPYGASSRDNREAMAPNLLLWDIARWGKAHGYKQFDLWGAMGPHPDITDPWYGFHRFKEGFRPNLVEFVGSYDLIINKPLYELYKLADNVRWKLLKLTSFRA